MMSDACLPALVKWGHQAELNQILQHVGKWTRFVNERQKFATSIASGGLTSMVKHVNTSLTATISS